MKDLALGAHHELVLVEGPQALVALGPEQPAAKWRKKNIKKGRVAALFLPLSAVFVCIEDGSLSLPSSLPTPFIPAVIMHSFLARRIRILKWVADSDCEYKGKGAECVQVSLSPCNWYTNQSVMSQALLAWKSASPPLALCNHWEVGTLRGDGGESIIKAGEVSGSCFDRGG